MTVLLRRTGFVVVMLLALTGCNAYDEGSCEAAAFEAAEAMNEGARVAGDWPVVGDKREYAEQQCE